MGGFRFRHLIAGGSPEGLRSSWQPDSAAVALDPGDTGTGVIVYNAPVWSPYDPLGENPDPSPADIQTLLGIYVVADKAVAATTVASGVPVFVPFNPANTALRPVPALGQVAAVSSTSALLPLQPGDCILATATTVADLVNLFAFVNAV